MLGQHNLRKGLPHSFIDLISRQILDFARKDQMLPNGEHIEENVELLAEAQAHLHLMHVVDNVIAVDVSVTAGGLQHASQHVYARGLAGTIVA